MSLRVLSVPSGRYLWVGDSVAGPASAGSRAAVVSFSLYLRKRIRNKGPNVSMVYSCAHHHWILQISKTRMLCTWQRLWWGHLGVAAWGVDAADLDEAGH